MRLDRSLSNSPQTPSARLARAQRALDELALAEGGHHDHGGDPLGDDLLSSRQAVAPRHGDIEEHDVRPQGPGLLDGGQTVATL